jgi:hypothetical protein
MCPISFAWRCDSRVLKARDLQDGLESPLWASSEEVQRALILLALGRYRVCALSTAIPTTVAEKGVGGTMIGSGLM